MLNPIMPSIALGSPVNWQSPVNRCLIAWWYCLPQTTGGLRWLDMCQRWHGTRTGSTLPSWSIAYNHQGGLSSINLVAANSTYLPIGGYDTSSNDPFSIGANNFTVTAWIRPTNVSTYQIVIGRDDDATHRDLIFGFGNTSGCILYATGRTTNGASPKESGNVLTSGAWNHIGAMRVGTTLTLWHNGAIVYTGTDTETGVIKQGTSLGRRNYSGFPQYYGGRLNDVRYHVGNGCPTPGEIYLASRNGYRYEINHLDRLQIFVGSTSTIYRTPIHLLMGGCT